MGGSRWLLKGALALAALTVADSAVADSMDPALGRLMLTENCRTPNASNEGDFYDPSSRFSRCLPNDAQFAKLVAQLGTAVAPLASHPARTTGFGGYRFGITAAYTTIDNGANYWKKGTQGPPDPSTGKASIENISPSDVLQLYSVYLAKGFPFGIELGAGFGYLADTEIIAGGGDVRVAIFEGFREHIPGYFPDIGVGGAVRTITGTSEMKITVASFDAELSKPIPIAGTVVLQPHVGYQFLYIFGDSGLIDVTPNTDSLTQCGFVGDNNPSSPDPTQPDFDGQPVCSSGYSADFNNDLVFDKIRLWRHRITFGAQLRYQMVNFGVHVATDAASPLSVNGEGDTVIDDRAVDPTDPSGRTTFSMNKLAADDRSGDPEVSSQWTVAVELGAVF